MLIPYIPQIVASSDDVTFDVPPRAGREEKAGRHGWKYHYINAAVEYSGSLRDVSVVVREERNGRKLLYDVIVGKQAKEKTPSRNPGMASSEENAKHQRADEVIANSITQNSETTSNKSNVELTRENLLAQFKTPTAEEFIATRDRSKRHMFLTTYTAEQLQEKGAKLYLSDEWVGFALTADGDMIGVFNNSERRGAAVGAVILAIALGIFLKIIILTLALSKKKDGMG